MFKKLFKWIDDSMTIEVPCDCQHCGKVFLRQGNGMFYAAPFCLECLQLQEVKDFIKRV